MNNVALSIKVQLTTDTKYDELEFSDSDFSKKGVHFLKETLRFTNLTLKASGTFRCNVNFYRNGVISGERGIFPTINITITVLGNILLL